MSTRLYVYIIGCRYVYITVCHTYLGATTVFEYYTAVGGLRNDAGYVHLVFILQYTSIRKLFMGFHVLYRKLELLL